MPATTEERIKFRDTTLPIFASIQNEFEIQIKIAMTHAAEESNWGLSRLATEGMNLFSITPGDMWVKAKNGDTPMDEVPNWSSLGKPTVFFNTTEYHALPPEKIRFWDFRGDIIEKKPDGKGGSILVVERHFRKYADWKESSWDWARKIAKTPRYSACYEAAKAGDVVAYAGALQRSGYATDPRYSATIFQSASAVTAILAA